MKKSIYVWMACLLVLVLCMGLSAASAANADYVRIAINDRGTPAWVTLNAANPYWINGATAPGGSDSTYNAYFDTSGAAPVLRLRDASVDVSAFDTSSGQIACLIYASGDIQMDFSGTNTLRYSSGTDLQDVSGIYGSGSLTLAGSGSMNITLYGSSDSDTHKLLAISAGSGSTQQSLTVNSGSYTILVQATYITPSTWQLKYYGAGLYTDGTLTINGGSFDIRTTTRGGFAMHGMEIDINGGTMNLYTRGQVNLTAGIWASNDLNITNGVVTAEGETFADDPSQIAYGIVTNRFLMTGGTVTALAGQPASQLERLNIGLYFNSAQLQGGTGQCNTLWWGEIGDFNVTGGEWIVTDGMYSIWSAVPTQISTGVWVAKSLYGLTDMKIIEYRSASPDIKRWRSIADGALLSASHGVSSTYLYVKFMQEDMPQTGDPAAPGLWLGVLFVSMLGLGMLGFRRRRA